MSRFTQKQVEVIYRRRAKHYFWTHLLTTLGHCQFKWRPLLAKLALADLPKVSEQYNVLDLCTGWGLSMAALWREYQKKYKHYTPPFLVGLDMSLEMVQIGMGHRLVKARQWNLHYIVGLAQHLPFSANTFHAITMMCGMGGIPPEDQKKVIEEILRVLKPSGKIFILDVTHPPRKTLGEKIGYWPLKVINKLITKPYVLSFWGWESIQELDRVIKTTSYNGYIFTLDGCSRVYSEPLYPFAHVQIIGAEKIPK